MDERIDLTKPAPTARRFRLTPLPQPPQEPDELSGKGNLRRKLIVGGSAIPFAMTVRGRRAFAQGAACSVSFMLSQRLSTPGSNGGPGPCALSSTEWASEYSTVTNAYLNGTLPPQVSGIQPYLGNPSPGISGTSPFSIPSASHGISFSIPSGATFLTALQGTCALTVTVSGLSGTSANDNGAFFAQAIAALFNGAFYGTLSNHSASSVITYVNGMFTTIQNNSPGQTAQQIISTINNTYTSTLTGWN